MVKPKEGRCDRQCSMDAGELAPLVEEFAVRLRALGHSRLTVGGYEASARHFACWLARAGLAVGDVDDDFVDRFARHRCRCPGTRRLNRVSEKYARRARRFVAFLADRGVVRCPTCAPPPAPDREVRAFQEWLRCHRGISERTIDRHGRMVMRLLPALGSEPERYNAHLVRQVILVETKQASIAYVKTMAMALRGYLRFLGASGLCPPGLDQAVPIIPQWRLSALPRYIDAADVERLIATCDLAMPTGVRDQAILILLARLGLRAGDIVALCLDDVDWRQATISVCGKGRRETRLPLPQDAGDAVLAYLDRSRPRAACDRLFLTANAPFRPLSGSTVSSVVRRALDRAAIAAPSQGTSAADRAALAGRCVMLSQNLARYVDLQRSLGFKFRIQHILLRGFAAFAEEHGDRHIKGARVLAWAARAPSPEQRRNRLLTVRRFALAMHAEDGRHEVPAADALGHAVVRRRPPYIYTPGEIARLIRAAAALRPAGSMRPLTYATMLGLLAATGMRISEALALQLDDVTADGLLIRETKFQKSRLLPLHATTQRALDTYLAARAKLGCMDRALFVSGSGGPLSYNTVRGVFDRLRSSADPDDVSSPRKPRIHDLRHTFAVRSLEQCRHDCDAVARHVVALSTYLGHAHVTDTYWYLQATPLLMEQIARDGEALLSGGAA